MPQQELIVLTTLQIEDCFASTFGRVRGFRFPVQIIACLRTPQRTPIAHATCIPLRGRVPPQAQARSARRRTKAQAQAQAHFASRSLLAPNLRLARRSPSNAPRPSRKPEIYSELQVLSKKQTERVLIWQNRHCSWLAGGFCID